MLNIDYRDLNTIRAKLALLAAASIVDYQELNSRSVNECYEAEVSVSPGFDSWIFIDFDGDATLEIDGDVYAAYTGNRVFRVNPGIHRVRLCLSNVGYSGGRFINFKSMYLIQHAPKTLNFVIKALVVSEVAEAYDDIRNALIMALNKALDSIMVTTVSGKQISMFMRYFSQYIRPIPDFLGSIYAYYTEEELNALPKPDFKRLEEESERALEILDNELRELGKLISKRGILYTTGYSHLDLAWLWSVDVTRQKIRRTVGDMIAIHRRYPEAKFVWSNAAFLKWLEDDDSRLFEEFRRAVNEGWIVLVGGMWVESDTNLPGGESLVRQFLYGQKYLQSRFGRLAIIGWLPDTFGFPASLPQILKKAGIKAFLEAKLSWSTINKFPYSIFLWEGIDGTRILTINPRQFWGELHPNDIKGAMQHHSLPNIPAYQPFGRTDGGGSTTWISMERYRVFQEVFGIPTIIIASPEDYVKAIEKRASELPLWRGELYLETHRGVYSNGTAIKKLVRELETDLRELEFWSALLGLRENYEELWYPLLEAEYHDPMGATNTKQAFDDIMGRLIKTKNEVKNRIDNVLARAVDRDDQWITVFNSLPWPREGIIKLNKPLKGLPAQWVEDGYLVLVKVPASGAVSYEFGEGIADGDVVIGNNYIENSLIRVEFTDSLRIYDKQHGRWAVRNSRLIVCEDIAIPWSGWNLEGWYRRNCKVLTPSNVEMVEKGPLRGSFRVKYLFNNSEIDEWVSIETNSRLVNVRITANWRERLVVVRYEFEVGVRGDYAVYEIPYGVIKRPNNPSNSWELAKFEVPAWRWGELGDEDYGVAIINKGTQGYSAMSNTIGLTLWRSPMFPNPFLDLGNISVEFAIYPHGGDWTKAETPRIAQSYNTPLRTALGKSSISGKSLLTMRGGALLESVKVGEDGKSLVMRLWEIYGRETTVELEVTGNFTSAEEADLLERSCGKLDMRSISLKPFEIKTVILRDWRP
ncbi:MAG: glycoside hydrolase family 38 C-terminal domain-containing protein [Vulcanisaeta sp.]